MSDFFVFKGKTVRWLLKRQPSGLASLAYQIAPSAENRNPPLHLHSPNRIQHLRCRVSFKNAGFSLYGAAFEIREAPRVRVGTPSPANSRTCYAAKQR